MTIIRYLNGRKYKFPLTEDELQSAYNSQQRAFDAEDVLSYIDEMLSSDSTDSGLKEQLEKYKTDFSFLATATTLSRKYQDESEEIAQTAWRCVDDAIVKALEVESVGADEAEPKAD